MGKIIQQEKKILIEEAIKTEIVISKALINILISKQIISEEELIKSIGEIRYEQQTIMYGES